MVHWFEVLVVAGNLVRGKGYFTRKDLVEELDTSEMSVAKHVERLVKRGLIKRLAKGIYTLTEEGARTLAEYWQGIEIARKYGILEEE